MPSPVDQKPADLLSCHRRLPIVQLIRTRFRYDQFPLYEKANGRWRTVR